MISFESVHRITNLKLVDFMRKINRLIRPNYLHSWKRKNIFNNIHKSCLNVSHKNQFEITGGNSDISFDMTTLLSSGSFELVSFEWCDLNLKGLTIDFVKENIHNDLCLFRSLFDYSHLSLNLLWFVNSDFLKNIPKE